MRRFIVLIVLGIVCLIMMMPECVDGWMVSLRKKLKSYLNIRRLKLVIISTTLFMLVTHLYAWMNGTFLFDTAFIYRGIPRTLIVSDKWLGPYVWMLDAGINQPWLAGMLAIFFMIISVYCIVDILEIDATWSIFLIAGLCSTNSSIICQQEYTGGNYTGEIALALACVAMWVIIKINNHVILKTILAAFGIALSAGMYGAYVSIVPSLMLLILIGDIFNGRSGRDNWRKVFLFLMQFLMGMTLYYVILRSFMYITSEQLSAYMGEDNLNSVSGIFNMLKSIPGAYLYLLKYYVNSQTYLPQYLSLLLFAIMLTGGIVTVYWAYKRRENLKDLLLNVPLLVSIVMLLPLSINLIYVMASGQVHYLMIFTYIIPLLFFVKVMEDAWSNRKEYRIKRVLVILGGLLSIFIYYSIVTANAVYTHYHNMYDVSLSIGTRILDRIETCEGFEGTEQIVLLGQIQENLYYGEKGYEEATALNAFLGCGNPNNINGLNYGSWMKKYLQNILDSKLEYVHYDFLQEYIDGENVEADLEKELLNLQVFPKQDSVKKIGNKIYIKFSDS